MPISEVFLEDCMVGMSRYPDKFFDLAIVDPPYGIGVDGQKRSINKNPKHNRKEHKHKGWDNDIPNEGYFTELKRVSKNQIIWGANYFVKHLTEGTKGWIFWYKGQTDLTMSDGEFAYTSFDTPSRIVQINRVELLKDGTIHPTQKPVRLYRWLLDRYATAGDKILDTHMGSQSLRIATYNMSFDFGLPFNYYGWEIDKEYFETGNKRFKEQTAQQNLFV